MPCDKQANKKSMHTHPYTSVTTLNSCCKTEAQAPCVWVQRVLTPSPPSLTHSPSLPLLTEHSISLSNFVWLMRWYGQQAMLYPKNAKLDTMEFTVIRVYCVLISLCALIKGSDQHYQCSDLVHISQFSSISVHKAKGFSNITLWGETI